MDDLLTFIVILDHLSTCVIIDRVLIIISTVNHKACKLDTINVEVKTNRNTMKHVNTIIVSFIS